MLNFICVLTCLFSICVTFQCLKCFDSVSHFKNEATAVYPFDGLQITLDWLVISHTTLVTELLYPGLAVYFFRRNTRTAYIAPRTDLLSHIDYRLLYHVLAVHLSRRNTRAACIPLRTDLLSHTDYCLLYHVLAVSLSRRNTRTACIAPRTDLLSHTDYCLLYHVLAVYLSRRNTRTAC